MKFGTENRNKVVAAGILMLVAVLLLGRMFLVDSGPSASTPLPEVSATSPTSSQSTSSRRNSRTGKSRPPAAPSLDPRLRLDLLKSSEDVSYAGTGRNIFMAQAEPPIPKPIAPARIEQQGKQAPSGPPAPPPINLKFFGFANKPGEPKRVFLAKGDDVFIAGEGDIVDRRYKVVRIGPNSIELQDVLNPNNRQSIPITQG